MDRATALLSGSSCWRTPRQSATPCFQRKPSVTSRPPTCGAPLRWSRLSGRPLRTRTTGGPGTGGPLRWLPLLMTVCMPCVWWTPLKSQTSWGSGRTFQSWLRSQNWARHTWSAKPCGRAGCLCTASSFVLLGKNSNQTSLEGDGNSAPVKGLGVSETAEDTGEGNTVSGSIKSVGS